MPTSTELELVARTLSMMRADPSEAVDELLRRAGGRRVFLVPARQHLGRRASDPDDGIGERAIALIDEALQRGSWSD